MSRPPALSASLSRPEQLNAQRRFLSHALFNPFGASLTIGSVCTLLALHYGANDLQMGLLYAAIYITGIFAVLTPSLFQGMDASRIASRSWWLRSFIAGGILFFPFIPDASVKSWLLVVIILIFLSIRAVGVSTIPSVLRAITLPQELRSINAEAQLRWYFGSLITAVAAWAVLSQRAHIGDENAFIALFAVGFIFNMVSSQRLSTIPPTGRIERGSFSALASAAVDVAASRSYREVVWITLLQVPMAVAAAYQINALKTLGYSPEAITALTVIGLAMSVAGSRALVLIGRRIPFRPLLLGSHIVLFLTGCVWIWIAAVPTAYRGVTAGVLFAVSTLFITVSGTLLAALSNERLPAENAISFSVIYQIAGVIAAFAGMIAVQILGTAPLAYVRGMHSYSHAFILWSLLALGVCVFTFVMVKGKIGHLASDIAQVMPSNLMTVFRAHDATVHAASRPSEVREFENVLASPVPSSAHLILEALRHPEARHRVAAFHALYENPLPAAAAPVAAEALNRYSPIRGEAINALGFIHVPAAARALHTLARSGDEAVAARAMKGLLRHGAVTNTASIMRRYRSLSETSYRMDILWGMIAGRQLDLLWKVLAFELVHTRDRTWIRTVFIILAEAHGDMNRLSELYQRKSERSAFAELCAELPDPACNVPLSAWRHAVAADGSIRLPKNAQFPHDIRPRTAAELIGILHLSRLSESTSFPRNAHDRNKVHSPQ